MSYTLKRTVPKKANPYGPHAASSGAAQKVLRDRMDSEVGSLQYGYTPGEFVTSVVLAEETEERFTFDVHISGD